LDWSCFSTKYFGNWLLSGSQTKRVQPIILSQSGHQAEELWQILKQLDQLLAAVEAFSNQASLDVLVESLKTGGILSKSIRIWKDFELKLGFEEAEKSSFFYPLVKLPQNAKWDDLQTFEVDEQGQIPRLYPSKFAFSNDGRH